MDETAHPQDHPDDSPRARRRGSAATREALLAAARRLFMEQGFDGVSVRAIAREAGVDAAMINHSFGGKEALFQEVMALPVDPGQAVARVIEGATVEELPHRLVHLLVDIWESPETGPAMIALLRRTLSDPRQMVLMRSFMVATMFEPASAVIQDRWPDDAQLRLSLVATQVIGTLTARHVLQLEPLASLPTASVAPLLERSIGQLLLDELPVADEPDRTQGPQS